MCLSKQMGSLLCWIWLRWLAAAQHMLVNCMKLLGLKPSTEYKSCGTVHFDIPVSFLILVHESLQFPSCALEKEQNCEGIFGRGLGCVPPSTHCMSTTPTHGCISKASVLQSSYDFIPGAACKHMPAFSYFISIYSFFVWQAFTNFMAGTSIDILLFSG